MRARLVAEIDLGTQPARNIEHVDGRFFIATDHAVHAVDGDALAPVPMIEAAEVIDLRGAFVLTDRAIVEIGGATRPLPPLDGAQPATFLPLLDGTIVALHDKRDPTKAAVWRLDREGKPRWRTPMPVPSQLLAEREQLWPGDQDKDVVPLRRPRIPVQWTISRGGLCVSRDRLLAVFVSSPGIGIGFGIDVQTGSVLYGTPPAPHRELAPAPVTAAGPGAFFVGVQGYGLFETSLVDRDGRAVTRWHRQADRPRGGDGQAGLHGDQSGTGSPGRTSPSLARRCAVKSEGGTDDLKRHPRPSRVGRRRGP